MNGHKKNAGSLSIINLKALVSPLSNNRTTARAYTIYIIHPSKMADILYA